MTTPNRDEFEASAPRTEVSEQVILFLPRGRDAEVTCRILGDADLDVHACDTLDALTDRIATGVGVVIAGDYVLEEEVADRLMTALGAQPPWSDVPLLVLAQRADDAEPLPEIVRRYNVTVLERPLRARTLVTSVQAALRARQRQYEVRDLHVTLQARVDARTRQVRKLAGELTLAEQRERKRISHVLHDGVQQLLYGMQMRAEMALSAFPAGEHAKGTAYLKGLLDLLQEATRATRTLTTELTPPVRAEDGLDEAVAWLRDWMEDVHGLTVQLDATSDLPALTEDMHALLFRLVRELLFNVVKHADTRDARVRLWTEDGHYHVVVSDEGAGFDPEAARTHHDTDGGFGLFNARDGLRVLGGHLEIDSAPGEGTRVYISVPLSGGAPGSVGS